MPQSIPPGLKPEHVLKALADLDAGMDHPFGQATKFELIYQGQRYAPKAAIGLACKYLLGRILLPEDFSGGEAPGQANFVLRNLGLSVIKKGTKVKDDEEPVQDWSETEVRLVVADYFAMLEAELLGKRYSKTEHRKALAPKLDNRSKGSIEFKNQNISAVLTSLGLPYIEGYKPRGNFQALLAQEIEAFLDRHPGLLGQLSKAPLLDPDKAPRIDNLDLKKIVKSAPKNVILPTPMDKPWPSRRRRRVDFAERDATNRRLAKMGEEFVVRFERQRLTDLQRDDLARKVAWVSETIGDGLGFDVLSFNETDGSEKLIEVKTTGLGKFFPFYVTINELSCSEDVGDQFQLFRVFDFTRRPRLYIVSGPLPNHLKLDPVQFRASI